MNLDLYEQYGQRRAHTGLQSALKGVVEVLIRDVRGQSHDHYYEPNIVKIFAKEILAHRLPYSKIWDPNGGTGTGAWVDSGLDPLEEFAAKYILFGASYDTDGSPLDSEDQRYYTLDDATGLYVPNRLGVGADFDGGLINPILLAEPNRTIKRIERIYFEPSYQPAGTPLLQSDVRCLNNVVVLETTLRKEEYNGFGLTHSDFFTITEVALAGGKIVDNIGTCECGPETLFLDGRTNGTPLTVMATGTATVTLDSGDTAYVDLIKEGDQVKLVSTGSTVNDQETLNQVNPNYLVINKAVGGSDIVLDRTPENGSGIAITGQVGLYRNSLRIYSHRILQKPFKKSGDFEIIVRWHIMMA